MTAVDVVVPMESEEEVAGGSGEKGNNSSGSDVGLNSSLMAREGDVDSMDVEQEEEEVANVLTPPTSSPRSDPKVSPGAAAGSDKSKRKGKPTATAAKGKTEVEPKSKSRTKRKLNKEEREAMVKRREEEKAKKEKKEKEAEAKKRQQEKEREEREEKKRVLEKEKKDRKDRLEKERKEKLEKIEKEKEKSRLQREADKLRKQQELEAKMEEKKIKDDERMKKAEEKRQIDEEKNRKVEEKKRALEEEKRRQEKVSAKFMHFFKKGDGESSLSSAKATAPNSADRESTKRFRPFHLKPFQTLAPIVRQSVKDNFVLGAFDSIIQRREKGKERNIDDLYLALLRNGCHFPHIHKKIKKRNLFAKDMDVIVLENESDEKKKYKAKLLQFTENTRPPWFGTWRKRSAAITGRNPLGREPDVFDYNVDSDEDWEEEGPGESINGSDSEKSGDDDYEIDNDLFVPHGYLSSEEQEEEGKERAGECPGDDPQTGSLLKERELLAQRNTKHKELHPLIIGCIWVESISKLEDDPAYNVLKERSEAVFLY